MRVNLWKPEPKKRSGIVRRAPVVPGLPLSKYSMSELAVRVARQSDAPKVDPGIAWARLMRESNRPEKDAARDAVLRLLTVEQFPSLGILTFPASDWRFERALLAMREEPERIAGGGPRRTTINAVERDEAVFRAAVHNIPRPPNVRRRRNENAKDARRRRSVSHYPAPEFASSLVRSAHIAAFLRCAFEDFAYGEVGRCVYDAAWLDFNGQLTPSRLNAIEHFWRRRTGSLLVVTLLNARAASPEARLTERLSGATLEDASYYGDGAPMVQLVYRRTSGTAEASFKVADGAR